MAIHNKQMTFADVDEEYKQFVEKFKPKKTTDDCYHGRLLHARQHLRGCAGLGG